MFHSQSCVPPMSSHKMFPSLCLYPRQQHWELLSRDQFPPVLPSWQHANVPAHFPGPGLAMGLWAARAGLGAALTGPQDPAQRLLCSCGHREALAGREGTGSTADFLVKDNKSSEWGSHTSLFAWIMISTITINPFFQLSPVEQPEWTSRKRFPAAGALCGALAAGLGWTHQLPVLMEAAESLAQAAKPAQEVTGTQKVSEPKPPAGQHVSVTTAVSPCPSTKGDSEDTGPNLAAQAVFIWQFSIN